jgi:transposase
MRSITFSAADLRAIAHDRYRHPDPRVQRKCEVLWLKHHGFTHERIAALAGVSRNAVQRYLTEFRHGGLTQLQRCPWTGPLSALDVHRVSLEEYFRAHPPRTVREAQQVIEQRTGLRRGLTQVRRFLHRLGAAPRKVSAIPVPPKVTVAEHAQTQHGFRDDKLDPVLAEARAGHREVYFVDAAHFVFAAFLGWVWCWQRWCVRAAAGRKRYNVLGAVHAVSHRLIQVTNHSYINAESVCTWLRALAAASVGKPITVVLDNARYQKCALVLGLAQQLGIDRLYLPSYSPNLNLIERVWRFVQKEALRARYHATYEEFTTAIDQCLQDLSTEHKQAMDTLLTHDFQMFEDVSLLAA